MRPNVKPLTHWLIYKGYTVRFQERHPEQVTGVLTTPEGQVPFQYDPQRRVIHLPGQRIVINAYGWEVDKDEPEDSTPSTEDHDAAGDKRHGH